MKQSSRLLPETTKPVYYIGIFIISLSTLLLEFTMTRVLSVSLWYHFAFMIISVALLGFGISGVVLSLSRKLNEIPADKILTILAMCFGGSIILSFILMNKIPFDPFSLLTETIQLLYLPVYYLLITIPFFFAGLIISILLSRFKKDIPKLYFFDLIGAGLACIAFVIFIPLAGGNGSVLFTAMLGFIAAIIFSYENHKTLSLFSFILLLLSFSFLIDKDSRFPINTSPNKIYGNYIAGNPDLKIRTDWNTISRIDVMKDEETSEDGYDILLAIIDAGNASTNIPKLTTLPPPNKPADASNLAFTVKENAGKVFILGSAGGGEILTSLYHNADKITAVEINGILNDYLQKDLAYWVGPLVNNENVELITDDARAVISSGRDMYDVIISAHTISASAVSSGAMSMVENYIMTEEAMEEYLKYLNNNGILYITRPETQVPKILSTIKKVAKEKGVEAGSENFIVFRRPPSAFEGETSFLAGVIYKKDGFDSFDVIKMKNEASALSLDIEYDPTSRREGIYKEIIESGDVKDLYSKYGNKIIPATDNSPFFDQNIGFGNLTLAGIKETFSQDDKAILALKDKPVAETTLIALFVQTVIIAGLLILLPLRKLKPEKLSKKKLRSNESKISARAGDDLSIDRKFLGYFACLGFGYIMLQICMIQKFTLFLGQPVITLLTVVSTMLIASGLGSLFSTKIYSQQKKKLYLIFGMIIVLSVLIGIFNPVIFSSFVSVSPVMKIIISALMIFPLGFFMGMPFPLGLSFIGQSEKRFVAFAWGINGFFSVIGTVSAIILAMTTGFTLIFIIVALFYLLAMLLILERSEKFSKPIASN
jgi:hypothetical protein